MTLALRTLRTAVIGFIVLGALLFVPAGTLAYWNGWGFIAVFTVMTNVIGLYLGIKDPALLARRIKAGPTAETRPAQRLIMGLSAIAVIGVLVLSALDWRLRWSHVSPAMVVLGDVLVVLGLLIDLLVFRENRFGASTIETMEGQTVISTGPYALVRHPMYLGVIVMMIGVPLSLGSYWGELLLLFTVPILMARIVDEEKMLTHELPGYDDYARRVRYRLAPGIW